MTRTLIMGALGWAPEVKGALYVLLCVLTLCGSCYLLLATNMGARLGFMLATAGLLGWLVTGGAIWWAYGKGVAELAPAPSWHIVSTVTGDLASARTSALRGFPKDWEDLPLDSREVADAVPVAEGQLVRQPGGPARPYANSSEFILIGAFEKGGDRTGPFGVLNFRPFNVFHKARYLAVQVQGVKRVETLPGQPPPRAEADPAAEKRTVVLIRDLGARRLYPAVFTISTGILFGLVCYQLHVRDKEAAARKLAATERPLQPVR